MYIVTKYFLNNKTKNISWITGSWITKTIVQLVFTVYCHLILRLDQNILSHSLETSGDDLLLFSHYKVYKAIKSNTIP